MRRVLLMLLAAIVIVVGVSLPAFAGERSEQIPVFIDGIPVVFNEVEPVIQNNRTLAPFRAVAEALNVEVLWDNSTRTVKASDGNISIRLQIGNTTAYRNESPILLDVPPVINNGRTLIPLRFFSEAFDCKVEWDNTIRTVKITSSPKEMTVMSFYALGDNETSSWEDLFGKAYPEVGNDNTDVVDKLAFGWYSLNQQGDLLTESRTGWQRPDGWEKVLEAASKYNLETEMVVHLTDEDGSITNLLTNKAAMNKAAAHIISEAAGYNGINLDFEGLGLRDSGEELTVVKNNFTNFVRLISENLKPNCTLSLSLHAPNSAYKGYDYHSLGQHADRIIIMAYDYGPKPEPVNLVVQAVEMAKAEVPAEKLLLGISTSYETPESILTKVGIAKKYGLKGIALWRLGLVSGEMWDSLRTTIEPKAVNRSIK